MCALKSRGMYVVCTWGLRWFFFHTCNFLCSSPMVLCAFVQVLSSTYVPYNIPLSLILWTCIFLTYFWPSAVSPILCWSTLCAYFWPSASHHPWRHLTSSLLLPRPPLTLSPQPSNSHLRVTKLHFPPSPTLNSHQSWLLIRRLPPLRHRSLL